MKKVKLMLTLEELSTLNEAIRFAAPFPVGRRKRVFEALRQRIREELAEAIEEEQGDGE